MDNKTLNSIDLASSKLGKLLIKLNKDELRSLHKSLRSPWLGGSEAAGRLLEVLMASPLSSSLKVPKEKILKAVFPQEQPLNLKMLNKAMNSLLMATEKFLVHEELKQDPLLFQQLVMKASRRRSLEDYFETAATSLLESYGYSVEVKDGNFQIDTANQTVSPLELLPLENNELHQHALTQFQVSSSIYLQPTTEKFNSDLTLITFATSSLDYYYVASKLFFACEVFSRRMFIREEAQLGNIEDTIRFAQAHLADHSPTIKMYLWVLELLRHGCNDKLFEQSKRFFLEAADKMGTLEKQSILTFLINHANQARHSDNKKYLGEILQLYRFGLDSGIVFTNELLVHSTFINIANTATLNEDYKFALDFIQLYKSRLPMEDRESTVNVALAFLYFHQGKFDAAYKAAYKADLSSLRHALIAKTLMLRSGYEDLAQTKHPKISTALLAHLDAFRKYISRDKTLNGRSRSIYSKFINSLRKIIVATAKGSIPNSSKIRLLRELEEEPHPLAKNWLEEKVLSIPEIARKRQK